jgi:phage/plasmid primase-like uncharacterized protein
MDAVIADAKAVRVEGWLASIGHNLKRQGRELVGPCPVCGGDDRFAVNIQKQVWNCRGCQKGGDLIALVQHVEGMDFMTAIGTLTGNCTGGGTISRRREIPATAEQPQADTDTLQYADRIWRETVELTAEAIAYFANRGIDIATVPDHGGLRFHPRCPWENGTKHAIVGRYTAAASNEPRGIWRRPIDGSKPKAIGPSSGCVIRLWPDDAVELGLVIGEGVETTLAAATRIKHRGTLLQPAWATGSAGNMSTLPALPGIECLTILVDNDVSGAGQKAAAECAKRWQSADREVIRLLPHKVEATRHE